MTAAPPAPEVQEQEPVVGESKDVFRPFAGGFQDFVNKKMLQKVDYSRQTQLLMALRNNLFWQGKQYLKYSLVNGNGVTVMPATAIPGGAISNEPQVLSYVINDYRGDGQKLVSVIGGRVPYVTITARNAQNPDSIAEAKRQRAVADYLDKQWDIENAHKDLARDLYRNGPVFGHVCYTTDEKYGTVTIDKTELVDHKEPDEAECQQCGTVTPLVDATAAVPCPNCGSEYVNVTQGVTYKKMQVTGSQDVPRGMPELHPYTIFEVAIPPERKSLEKCEWLDCTVLESVGKLRNLYGDLMKGVTDDYPAGGTTSAQETAGYAFGVITAAGPTQNDREDKLWWRRSWITQDMYPLMEDQAMREACYKHAPNGLRLVFVNEKYIQAVPERLTEVWVVCKTGTDSYIMGDPIGNDLVPFQTITNDFFNLAIETVMRAIPKTLIDPSIIDRTAIQNNPVSVAELIYVKMGQSGELRNKIAQLPVAAFSEQMMPLEDRLSAKRRDIGGLNESLFGGGEPAPTARQETSRRNAALQQHTTAWDNIRSYRSGAVRLAIAMMAKHGMGTIEVVSANPFAFKPSVIDLTDLHPELVEIDTDEKMPQNRNEQYDEYRENYESPPPVVAALGMFDAINIPRICELAGMDDIMSTAAHVVEKTLRIISVLVESEPVPAPPGMPGPDGMMPPPGPPQPSIQPDPFDFDNKNAMIAVEIVRAFCNSPEGIAEDLSNPPGMANVRAFGNALQKMATPPPPQEPPSKSLSISAALKDMAPNQAAAILKELADITLPPPVGLPPSTEAQMLKPKPPPPGQGDGPPAGPPA